MSFLIANVGLNAILNYSLPVLMFLYPLAITPDPADAAGQGVSERRQGIPLGDRVYPGGGAVRFGKALAGALPAAVSTALHLTPRWSLRGAGCRCSAWAWGGSARRRWALGSVLCCTKPAGQGQGQLRFNMI